MTRLMQTCGHHLDSCLLNVEALFDAVAGVITHRGGSRLRHTESSTSGASPLVPKLERLVHLPSHTLHSILLLLLTRRRSRRHGARSGSRAPLPLLPLLPLLAAAPALPPTQGRQQSQHRFEPQRIATSSSQSSTAARDVVTVATDVPVARLASPAARPPASPPRTAAWGAAACLSYPTVRCSLLFLGPPQEGTRADKVR